MSWKVCLVVALLALPVTVSAQQNSLLADKQYGSWGVDLAARDVSIRPGDDFDYYAGGTWAKAAVIPPDSSFAGPYQDLRRLSEARLKLIIEQSPPASPVGALYRSFMDEKAIETRGIAPLDAVLAPITEAPDHDALWLVIAQPGFAKPPVTLETGPDLVDARRMSFGPWQGGLSLPDRDYYLLDRFAPQRATWRAYVERTLARTGDPQAQAHADAVVAFETSIAKVSYNRADAQDPTKSLNADTLGHWAARAPGIPWTKYVTASGFPGRPEQPLVVGQTDAIIAIARLWSKTPLDTLKSWAAFQTADGAARYLPHAFADDAIAFQGSLRGGRAAPSRERLAINLVDQRLGELIGRDYVARFFDPARKVAMLQLAENVKGAMRLRLAANTWLSPSSRATALAKLDRLQIQVGYPDVWRDYGNVRLSPDDLFGNVEQLLALDRAWDLKLYSLPIDSRRWDLTPQTVNAYNGGQELKIVFPAARLQPPFFGPANDAAANYGAIGAIIGHEISHSFDDRGRHVDPTGALKDWWTPADTAAFDRRISVLGAQYDAMEPLPGVHINGRLTMGENIADVAGLLASLDAYHMSLGGKPAPLRDGLTGDQRFFLAYAQARREKQTEEGLRDQLSTDDHAPSRFRVIGAVRNVDQWYDAFDVKPGDRYYVPVERRARIW